MFVANFNGNKKLGFYGIAEWYGKDMNRLTPKERIEFGNIALKNQSRDANPICPFMSSLVPYARCNKKGGVCSIRPYEKTDVHAKKDDPENRPAIVCPSRFVQRDLFHAVSKVMVDSETPILVKETPFLRQILKDAGAVLESPGQTVSKAGVTNDEKMAGRIDWILVNPESLESNDVQWCALETQALYFSGANMGLEFRHYAQGDGELAFPVGRRHPDYRSSGPKRLAPQLEVKVPVLRGWGKKVAVMVDRFFFSQMGSLPEAFARGKTDKDKRDNSEVIWFIVDFDEQLQLQIKERQFSTLDGSVVALNATDPLNKDEFTKSLKKVIQDSKKINKKVFIT